MLLRRDDEGFRTKVSRQLDVSMRTDLGLSIANKFIIALIIFSVVVVILETEPSLYDDNRYLFLGLEYAVLVFFSVEFLLRVWSSTENPVYGSRWAYLVRPVVILDFFVIVSMAFTLVGFEGVLLRMLRLLRLMRVARLGQYSRALSDIGLAIKKRRFELVVSFFLALMLLTISASALYVVEGELQPEAFGSIPRAMWWATATLTTVGYGDIVPITAMGQIFAGFTAVTGIGLIAMPTGILASAFSEIMQKRRKEEDGL